MDPVAPDSEPAIPEELRIVGIYNDFGKANEHALVILSMMIPYWMFHSRDQFFLCVEHAEDEPVTQQLKLYELENHENAIKTKTESRALHAVEYPMHVAAACFLIGSYTLQQKHTELWEASGVSDNIAIFENQEYWRVTTALTLHGDLEHLSSNLVYGFYLSWLLNRSFGMGMTLFILVVCGTLGNLTNAWVYYPETHRSLGASTALFGGLGALVSHGARLSFRDRSGKPIQQKLLPLVGGILLFSWFGFGTERTDVMAHLWGFLIGVLFGWAIPTFEDHLKKDWLQNTLKWTAFALIAVCWYAAIA